MILNEYSKTAWINGASPDINKANLDNLEQGVYDVTAKAMELAAYEVNAAASATAASNSATAAANSASAASASATAASASAVAAAASVAVYTDLAEDIVTLTADLSDFETNVSSNYALKSEVTNSLTPKGKIAYISLPTTGNTVGDYYYCSDGDGTNGAGNYVWNGTAWYFGGTGDAGYNIVKGYIDTLDTNDYIKISGITGSAVNYATLIVYVKTSEIITSAKLSFKPVFGTISPGSYQPSLYGGSNNAGQTGTGLKNLATIPFTDDVEIVFDGFTNTTLYSYAQFYIRFNFSVNGSFGDILLDNLAISINGADVLINNITKWAYGGATAIYSYKSNGINGYVTKQELDTVVNGLVSTTTKITVGVGQTYTTIKDALDAITDNSETNQYEILVKNGTYEVADLGVLYLGFKNYVTVKGEDKNKTIIKYTYSSTILDPNRSAFDPAYYGETIKYSKISNMTIITKGCKCPVHIDTTTSIFANGGIIEVENCNLFDMNTTEMTNMPLRDGQYNAGGVNVGLRNGQHVIVRDCYSNGAIYAHNTASQTVPTIFEVINCNCVFSMLGDLNSTQHDKAIFRNCKIQQVYLNATTANFNYDILFENNDIDVVTSVSSSDYSLPFKLYDDSFSGKFPVFESNIHKRVCNISATTITRGSLVQLSAIRGINPNATHVVPYTTGFLLGYALEDIAVGKIGIIQYKNHIEIPNITGIAVGDEIEYSSGVFSKKTTGKTVGHYIGSSIYSRYEMKIATI